MGVTAILGVADRTLLKEVLTLAEYTNNSLQTVSSNNAILFTDDPIPCRKGYVLHREGSGIFTLRGAVGNPSACFARYLVEFGANIAIPTGGTVGPISVAIMVNGESIPTSTAIVTPAAVNQFWNVQCAAYITIPRGCCFNISVDNVTDNEAIQVQNARLIVDRRA